MSWWPHARSARCTHLTLRTPGWGLSVAGGFLDNLEKRTCSARLPSHSPPQRGSRGDGLRAKGVRRPAPARHGGSGELGGATAARVCGIARQGGVFARAASITRDGEGTATSLPLGASAGVHAFTRLACPTPPPPPLLTPRVFAARRGAPRHAAGWAGATVQPAAERLFRSQVVTGTAHTPHAQSKRGVAGDAVPRVTAPSAGRAQQATCGGNLLVRRLCTRCRCS